MCSLLSGMDETIGFSGKTITFEGMDLFQFKYESSIPFDVIEEAKFSVRPLPAFYAFR
jgi:hypothetical protein